MSVYESVGQSLYQSPYHSLYQYQSLYQYHRCISISRLARPLLPGRSAPPARVCLSICIDAITGSRGNSTNFATSSHEAVWSCAHATLSRTSILSTFSTLLHSVLMISGHELPSEAGVSTDSQNHRLTDSVDVCNHAG